MREPEVVDAAMESGLTPGDEHPAALRPSDRQILAALRRFGELDRTEVARLSGMPRSTVTDSIGRLVRHGLVVERVKPADARIGAGRPPGLLGLAPPPGLVGVVLLTHESLHAGVLDFDGSVRSQQALDPYDYDHAAPVADALLTLLTQALAHAPCRVSELKCLVVGMPVPVHPSQAAPDSLAGQHYLPHQPSRSTLASARIPADPAGELSRALGIPAWPENDANLAALGEGALGAAKDMSSFIYIKITQGISAGLVLERRLHRGANGLAGELAHIHVDDDGAVCRCGGCGCLMTTFNARRLVDRIAAVHPRADSMADVLSLAAQGDAGVCRLLRDLGRTLGRSLADLAVYVAPDGIVIDGVLRDAAAAPVIDGIKESLHQFAPPAIATQVQVVVGTLAGNAELLGAAVLARSNLFGLDLLSRPSRASERG